MKTTKKWSKVLLLAILGMVLVFGLVLAGCAEGSAGGSKDKDDGDGDGDACCTEATFASAFDSDMNPIAAEIAKLPKCCQEAYAKLATLITSNPDPTEAELKTALGCCFDAASSLFD